MTSGDSYIYCAIISPEQVEAIKKIWKEINVLEEQIENVKADTPLSSIDRHKTKMELFLVRSYLFKAIRSACKNPVALSNVADDSWRKAYEVCSEYVYIPTPVKQFVEQAEGNFWKDPEVFDVYTDGYCIFLMSHYDSDDEFLEQIGYEYSSNGKYTPVKS